MRLPRDLPRRLAKAVAYGAVAGSALLILALAVRAQSGPLASFDEGAIVRATDVTRAHPALRDALVVWQDVFVPRNVYLVVTLGCVYLWRRGLKSRAAWGFATMMASWFLAFALKVTIQRVRPVVDDAVSHAPGYSFPSGHAANSAAATAVALILFWPMLGPRGRVAATVVGGTVVTLTALDRVYLGVHYPTDVLAGVIFGVGMAVASYRGYLDWNPER